MKFFKKIGLLVSNWSIEILNKTADGKKIDFAVGGQAVIEGVMMRSMNNIVIAVRKQNGKIKVDKRHYRTLTQKYRWLNIPILRGVINLFEMMIVGSKAINFSASEAVEDDADAVDEKESSPKKQTKASKIFEVFFFILSFIIAIGISIALFKFIPLWATTFFEGKSTYIKENYIVFNLIDGIIKMTIFLLYILILTFIPSFRRVFEYHGAEHKSIFNYEAHKELTVENAKTFTRFHPRCGTSFILIVFIISILVYTFIPRRPDFIENFAVRIAILPLIAGISYEYLKISAKYSHNIFVKCLIAPGLWFQRLTTKEPDGRQLEVGLSSLKEALALEEAK